MSWPAEGDGRRLRLRAAERFKWETAFEREDDRFDYREVRFVALGMSAARLHVLVFTQGSHEAAVRAISLRRALG